MKTWDHPVDLYAEASDLVDEIRKTCPEAAPVFFLLDTPSKPIIEGDFFDLTVGCPVEGYFSTSSEYPILWQYYLHARLAWETGGDWTGAKSWEDCGVAGIEVGRDESLEGLLNRVAIEKFQALSDEQQSQLREYAEPSGGSKRRTNSIQSQLLGARLLWTPMEETHLRPLPWIARALLLQDPIAKSDFLRGCLVCSPLARELLNRCFFLETRVRSLYNNILPTDPSDEAKNKFDLLCSGKSPERRFYPTGCPALPRDPWVLASFGDFLGKLPYHKDRRYLRDLLQLRNALAHQHYVSWHAVQCLLNVERSLDQNWGLGSDSEPVPA